MRRHPSERSRYCRQEGQSSPTGVSQKTLRLLARVARRRRCTLPVFLERGGTCLHEGHPEGVKETSRAARSVKNFRAGRWEVESIWQCLAVALSQSVILLVRYQMRLPEQQVWGPTPLHYYVTYTGVAPPTRKDRPGEWDSCVFTLDLTTRRAKTACTYLPRGSLQPNR